MSLSLCLCLSVSLSLCLSLCLCLPPPLSLSPCLSELIPGWFRVGLRSTYLPRRSAQSASCPPSRMSSMLKLAHLLQQLPHLLAPLLAATGIGDVPSPGQTTRTPTR